MRNCDNCCFGSYSLDVSTGKETLYCAEYEFYEYELEPNYVCELHQFIDGDENERYYVVYDDCYFGEGYFIVYTIDGEITKFLKLYNMSKDGYPNFGLRAFCVDRKDNLENEFSSIEFIFRSEEDYRNGLFHVFEEFEKNMYEELYTIDETQNGKNNISINRKDKIITLNISKDNYRGKQHPSDFTDIVLGDNYSCKNYQAINGLYNGLAEICKYKAKEVFLERLLKLNKKD